MLTPVGEFRTEENAIGFDEIPTTHLSLVESELASLLNDYKNISDKKLADLIDFYVAFKKTHHFTDENGHVGRLIAFKNTKM